MFGLRLYLLDAGEKLHWHNETHYAFIYRDGNAYKYLYRRKGKRFGFSLTFARTEWQLLDYLLGDLRKWRAECELR